MPLHVVVSPHFDDAVLSLGPLMSSWRHEGQDVKVVTVFAGGPEGPLTPAAEEDRTRYHGDPMSIRIAEDDRALALLDAATVRLGIPELVYRHRNDGTPRVKRLDDIFNPVLEAGDDDVVRRVRELVDPHVNGAEVVHVPSGVGDHVDHVIVREALRDLPDVEFYADLPYALDSGARGADWQVSQEDVELWIKAIECYETQVAIMFGERDWRSEFRQFART